MIISQPASSDKIHEAAMRGDTKEIAKLLKTDPKLLNAPDEPHGCIPTRWTPLHIAAWRGQTATVKYLVSKGANVNAKGAANDTPLHLAAGGGNSEIVKVLLSTGANANVREYRGDTPLHEAADWGVASLLIAAGANLNATNDLGETPLRIAASSGRRDIVRGLINKNAKVTIQEAAMIGDVGLVQRILQKEPGSVNIRTKRRQTPLHWALLFRHKDAARLLLDAGANVRAADEDGITPLHYAAANGYEDIAATLLDKGALLNIAVHSESPLQTAISHNQKSIVKLFLSKGADVNIRTYGFAETPMHTAAVYADMETVDILLSHGANINARKFNDGSGNAPLHLAVLHKRLDMVEHLIDKGADVNAIGDSGENTLHMAAGEECEEFAFLFGSGKGSAESRVEAKPEELVSLLISKGADVNAVDAYGNTVLTHAKSGKVAAILAAKGLGNGSIFDAALAGNITRLKDLVSVYRYLDAKKDRFGREPLHCAVIGGSLDVVKYLLSVGADIDATDESGKTPLHYAVAEGDAEMVRVLVESKADVSVRDCDDLTPLQLALKNGHKDIVDALLRSKAKYR